MQFTGWVGMDIIQEYLSTSDVCVDSIPKTSYSDACTMNKILQYMSAARPIVTFDLTETRISAQQAALYVQPNHITDLADKIAELLANEKARMRMGAYGRRRIEAELAWEHQRGNLLVAYEFVQQ